MGTSAWSDRRLLWALGGLSILSSIPYAVLGPNLLLDDWFTLAFKLRDGFLWTGGHQQLRARPGAWLVLLLEYGVIGAHPLVIYLLQSALVAGCGVVLFLAARRFVDRPVAAAVAGAWTLMANHSTLHRWGSAMPALVSLLLLLVGIVLLTRASDGGRRPIGAVAVLVASALTYEVSLPAAAVAVVAIPWARRRRVDVRTSAWSLAAMGLTGAWMFANSQHRGSFTGRFDFGAMVPAHFGEGLVEPPVVGAGLAMVGLFGTALALARPASPSLRGLPAGATRLVAVGLAVIVIGTVAFARYPIAPLGLGDRANAVAGVGTALVWVGIGMLLSNHRAVLVVASVVFGLVLLTGHLQRDVDYARAGDDTVAVVRALRAFPAPPRGGEVVVGPSMPRHDRIVGLIGVLDPVIQVVTGDLDRRARMANDPTDFFATPAARRLDVRPLLSPP
jgi:hypothetical protein